jgi:hypothetical protein
MRQETRTESAWGALHVGAPPKRVEPAVQIAGDLAELRSLSALGYSDATDLHRRERDEWREPGQAAAMRTDRRIGADQPRSRAPQSPRLEAPAEDPT